MIQYKYLNNHSTIERIYIMTPAPICTHSHESPASLEPISEETMYRLAELYRIFSDSTRIKILYTLFEHELCVCDISASLGMTVSAISHQLRVLKQARLVKYRKSGKAVYYSLSDDHVKLIIGQGLQHINEPR